MAGKSRELRVVITGDAKQLDRTFAKAGRSTDDLGKKGHAMGQKFSTGMKVAGAAAAGALVVGLKQATSAAIEAEKSQAAMEAQLRASGISYQAHAEDIEAVIQKHSKLAGVDDEELQAAFTAIVRTTGSVSTAMKDMGLVTDLARAKNMDVAKAGDIVAKVHAGQYKGLKQLNLEFVKTTANVDKLKASDDKITPAELAAAKAADVRANSTRALGLVQDKVKGQAEAYGETTAGAMERAGVAFENIQETIGAGLAPILEKVANKLADLSNWASENPGKFKAIAIVIASVGAAIGTLLIAAKIANAVMVLRTAMIGLNLAFLSNPVVLIVAGIAALGVALVVAYKKSETFRNVVNTAFKVVRQTAGTMFDVFTFGIRQFLVGVGKIARLAAKFPGMGWLNKVADGADKAASQLNKIGDAIKGVPKEKTLKLNVRLSADAKKALAALNKLGNTTGGPLGTGSLTRASGGIIPGTGDKDTVPVMATPGEFVVQRKIVQKYGPTFFTALNEGREPQFKTGGGIIRKAESIGGKYPYVWGGGHGRTGVPSGGPRAKDAGQIGYDCSGAVSAILGVSPPRTSGGFTSWGKPGAGSPNDTKVYANAEHVFAVLNGRGWGTGSPQAPDGGAGWLPYNHRSGFTIRHLEDGGEKGSSTVGDDEETSVSSASSSGPSKSERGQRAGSRIVNKIAGKFANGIATATRGASAVGGVIESADGGYGRSERYFGQVLGGKAGAFGEEDLNTAEGRAQRTTEVQELRKLKAQQLARMNKRKGFLKTAIGKATKQRDALRKARDKAKGSKRAGIIARLPAFDDRLNDLKAELAALGDQIADTTLDIGDLDKDLDSLAQGPEADVPSATDALGQALSDIDLKERAGLITPEQAKAARIETLQGAAAGQFGGLTERELWDVMGQLRDAQNAAIEAVVDNTSAIKDLKASIDAGNAIATSQLGIELAQASRALGDIIGRELGTRTSNRGFMPGDGQLARLT